MLVSRLLRPALQILPEPSLLVPTHLRKDISERCRDNWYILYPQNTRNQGCLTDETVRVWRPKTLSSMKGFEIDRYQFHSRLHRGSGIKLDLNKSIFISVCGVGSILQVKEVAWAEVQMLHIPESHEEYLSPISDNCDFPFKCQNNLF